MRWATCRREKRLSSASRRSRSLRMKLPNVICTVYYIVHSMSTDLSRRSDRWDPSDIATPGEQGSRRQGAADGFGDAQALVPFGHPLGAGERADLELRPAPADGEVHDGRVLALAGAGRHDRAPSDRTGGREGILRFGQCPGLVGFDERRVAGADCGGG